jgi:3-deoxy-7-phosphoheptulonate synthase
MEYLPSYEALKDQFPIKDCQRSFIENSRQTICNILMGKDKRLLLIVGPCSIHDRLSAKDFATRLKHLSAAVSTHFFCVMRAYCEKPRTTAGWKGFLYDPYLNGSNDIQTGIEWTRQLFLELTDLQIPLATEFLDPITAFYYEDLITWGSIGARTSSSQPHRQLASGLKIPMGIKNGLTGSLSSAINGLISASHPHAHISLSDKGAPYIRRTEGNPYTHMVLRGGENGPNYAAPAVAEALRKLRDAKLAQRLIIDCSHQNSGKKQDRQPFVFQSVIDQILQGNSHIRGLMLESHLQAGNQDLMHGAIEYGKSLTDECLDWHTTEQLILQTASQLNMHQSSKEEITLRYALTN